MPLRNERAERSQRIGAVVLKTSRRPTTDLQMPFIGANDKIMTMFEGFLLTTQSQFHHVIQLRD